MPNKYKATVPSLLDLVALIIVPATSWNDIGKPIRTEANRLTHFST